MARMLALAAFSVTLSLAVVDVASAQLGGLRRRAQEAVQAKITCALADTACQERARAEGKTVVIDSSKTPANTPPAAGAAATPGSAGRVGEGVWVNYDFTPGTRPLFVEDFSRDNVGDFPRRLEFGDGNMEIAEWQGSRWLRITSSPGKFSIALPEQLPERFTIEFDATTSVSNIWMVLSFADGAADDVRFRGMNANGQGGVFGATHQTQGFTTAPIPMGEVYRGRIMADGRYVKVYMNDTRVANIPNAELGRSNKITIEAAARVDDPVFIGHISIMAGGKKLYDELAASGRVSTQGIYFDTGSDQIRPESSPTLKEISQMLAEHPELKLAIEGHTDNVGAAASNQTLSEKRAEAVRQALITTYRIDGTRLTSSGLGSTKPAMPNETPEGRQANRRVELVRM
jgi:outer membrane protein OmpA-like peptidoglycan-associated protein